MGNKYFTGMLLAIFVGSVGFAQGIEADLTLQGTVTGEYIDYLQTQESTWQDQITNVGGDTPETMKAHMGLALLAFAYVHVDGDTTFRELDSLLTIMGDAFGNIYIESVDQILLPALDFFGDPHAAVNYFTDFFDSGDYESLRDSIDVWAPNFGDAADEADWLTWTFLENTDMHISDEQIGSHFTAIQRDTSEFEFTLTFADGEFADSLFVFSRNFFNRIDMLNDLGLDMVAHFEDGFVYMDSVGSITGADVSPAITSWRMGATSMITFIDSLKVTSQLQPFTPLKIDSTGFNGIQSGMAEVDTLLGGKTYQFGPASEGKTIKPAALIANLPGVGLEEIYVGFYQSGTPSAYTFGGIFPNGLDTQTLDFLSPDIVMSATASQEENEIHMDAQRDFWQTEIGSNPWDPDAHFGVALVDFYHLISEYPTTLFDIVDLLDSGRLDVLATEYEWADLDFSEELAGISDHLNYYAGPEPAEFSHFVMLIKTADDDYGQFEIGENSEFDIIHLPAPFVAIAAVQIQLMADASTMITDGLEHIYGNFDRMFNLDLDPNLLDFSDIESDSMLILRLEQANPDFMTITPYGISEFHVAGENLRDGFQEMGTFFDEMVTLMEAIQPYESDFDMNASAMMADMQEMSDIQWMMYEDFASPDSTSTIDGERVNFSAWFDNPPQSFLQMWKNYVFGIDSTLGGLFPERFSVDVHDPLPTLPREFTVYPAYPNPFNPETNIRFDLPKSEHVNVAIYNIRGKRIATLANEVYPAGHTLLQWNGQGVSSGIYYVRVNYQGQIETQKLVLLK